ncbi:hypothetical protein [Williamsoniiplasma lucivorax]|uniref:Thiamine transporter n=1 Tax=Williamsoniiplasma lucivorax TaxID=209274 RepID=A0A2S5RF86_9MOLU|nr:hypothetical protein [Williamsoniiplasma lucivorax]PPE05996.1 thiamine transporter [Williamsoniiplasma lucivorax]
MEEENLQMATKPIKKRPIDVWNQTKLLSQNKPKLIKLGIVFSIASVVVALCLVVVFSVWDISWTKLTDEEFFKNIKMLLIVIFTLDAIFGTLITMSWFLSDNEKIIENKMQFMLLSIISFAFINIGLLIYIFKKNKALQRREPLTWKRFWLRLGFRKLSVYDIVLCGMFTALTILFAYLEQFMPGLVGGGGLTFKYLGLIILGVAISPALSIIVGMTGALLSLLFVGSTFIISPWSFLLDYFVPMIIPGIVSILRFTISTKKGYVNYLNFIIVGFITFLGIYIIQTISGYFIWVAMAGGPAWGSNGVVYSVVYNALSIWPFNYPLTQVLMIPTIKVVMIMNKNKGY